MRSYRLAGATVAAVGLVLAGQSRTRALPACMDPSSGIKWAPSLVAAKATAAKEHKPILLLHLFGRLDEDLC